MDSVHTLHRSHKLRCCEQPCQTRLQIQQEKLANSYVITLHSQPSCNLQMLAAHLSAGSQTHHLEDTPSSGTYTSGTAAFVAITLHTHPG